MAHRKSKLKPFDVRKSLILDKIITQYESSRGFKRSVWRWIKRAWEYYCMGGQL